MPAMKRGANVALTREVPGLRHVAVGLSWRTVEPALDDNLVFAALLCDASGKARGDGDTVFFNQLTSPDLSVAARDAALGDDREQIEIDLPDVPPAVDEIVFAVWVNEGSTARRSLGQLRSLAVRVVNRDGGLELVRSEDLAAPLSTELALVVGAVYRHGGDWKFRVQGDAYRDVVALARDYALPL